MAKIGDLIIIGGHEAKDSQSEGVISIFDVRLHVMGKRMRFDLERRQPVIPASEETKPVQEEG